MTDADGAAAPTPRAPAALASLIAYLSEHAPLCPACDYSLKGATSDTCPECGSHLALQLAANRPTRWPRILGVIVLILFILEHICFAFVLFMFGSILSFMSGAVALGAVGGLLLNLDPPPKHQPISPRLYGTIAVLSCNSLLLHLAFFGLSLL